MGHCPVTKLSRDDHFILGKVREQKTCHANIQVAEYLTGKLVFLTGKFDPPFKRIAK